MELAITLNLIIRRGCPSSEVAPLWLHVMALPGSTHGSWSVCAGERKSVRVRVFEHACYAGILNDTCLVTSSM